MSFFRGSLAGANAVVAGVMMSLDRPAAALFAFVCGVTFLMLELW